jgi:hypothetical protein
MFRITIDDGPGAVKFQFEGKLVGPWVREAEECWQRSLNNQPKASRHFDLTGVTLVDAAGKAFLARAHADGVELIARGCLMRAIVAELTHTPLPDCG